MSDDKTIAICITTGLMAIIGAAFLGGMQDCRQKHIIELECVKRGGTMINQTCAPTGGARP